MAETAPAPAEAPTEVMNRPGTPNTAVAASNLIREQAYAYNEAHSMRQEAIDSRANSQEVSELNEQAKIAIYGTNGETVGYVDAAGNPLKTPIKGRLQEMRENPRYGTKQADRDKAADSYEKKLLKLVDDGFELCQAVIVMDDLDSRTAAAEAQVRDMRHKVTSLVNAGKTPEEAEAMVKRLMDKKIIKPVKENKDFAEVVKKDGIFTSDLERTYPGHSAKGKEKDPEPAPGELSPEDQLYDKRMAEFIKARDEFARISAGRGRRTLNFTGTSKEGEDPEFGKKALEAAQKAYAQAQTNLTLIEIAQARKAGLTGEDLRKAVSAAAAESEWSLATAVYNHRQVATGRAKFNRDGSISPVEPTTRFGKAARRIEDWLNQGKFPKAKRIAVMAGLGVAIGIPTALTGGMILGPILGGALGPAAASGLARSLMLSRASNKLEGKKLIDEADEELQGAIRDSDDPVYASIAEALGGQTERHVRSNRIRLGKAAIIGAAGAVGGDLIGNAIGLDHVLGHNSHHNGSGTKTTGGNKGGGASSTTHTTPTSGTKSTGGAGLNPGANTHSPQAAAGSHGSKLSVSTKAASSEYVWDVYNHAEGAVAGTRDMIHAAALAHTQGLIDINPVPGKPGEVFYSLTEAGAKLANATSGSSDTVDVMRVLSNFGNVKLS